jgi:predicted amidohydrolase YtcJ
LQSRDGKFVAVGRDEDVMSLRGSGTEIIDLKERRALPGLIDNHLHIIRGGLNFNMELRWDGVRRSIDGPGRDFGVHDVPPCRFRQAAASRLC